MSAAADAPAELQRSVEVLRDSVQRFMQRSPAPAAGAATAAAEAGEAQTRFVELMEDEYAKLAEAMVSENMELQRRLRETHELRESVADDVEHILSGTHPLWKSVKRFRTVRYDYKTRGLAPLTDERLTAVVEYFHAKAVETEQAHRASIEALQERAERAESQVRQLGGRTEEQLREFVVHMERQAAVALQDENRALHREIASLRQQLAESEARRQADRNAHEGLLKQSTREAQARYEAVLRETEELRQQLERSSPGAGSSRADVELRRLRVALDDKQTIIDQLQARLVQLQQRSGSADPEVNELQERIEALTAMSIESHRATVLFFQRKLREAGVSTPLAARASLGSAHSTPASASASASPIARSGSAGAHAAPGRAAPAGAAGDGPKEARRPVRPSPASYAASGNGGSSSSSGGGGSSNGGGSGRKLDVEIVNGRVLVRSGGGRSEPIGKFVRQRDGAR